MNAVDTHHNDPLHGVTLEMIVTRLERSYGWEELGRRIAINCFNHEPSVASSLKFLRRTPWARLKVENLYVRSLRDNMIHGDADRSRGSDAERDQ